MERPSQLILIRHAESARNKAKQGVYFADEEARKMVKGIPDNEIPLTEQGILQAQTTGAYLQQRFGKPDYCYHSGYERTVQTLQELLKAFPEQERENIPVFMNQFIRERDPGYTYDMTIEEAETAFPWLRDYWQTFGGFFARPPGGESLADVCQRVYNFLNMLFRDRAEKKVWIVLHGGSLRAMRFVLERWNYEQGRNWPDNKAPENCGVTRYEYDESVGRLVLLEYNTTFW